MDKLTGTKRFIEWTKRKLGLNISHTFYTEETRDNTGIKKALHVDLVLTTLFDFLDAKDLQSCRLVCLKWEQTSRSYFAKRSKVLIAGDENSDVLNTFTETFCDATVMPFTKFWFKGFFPTSKFEDFLDSWPTLTELFLEDIRLADTDGIIYKEYALNNSIFLNLKTLSFHSSIGVGGVQTKALVIRFSQIRSIKNLHLNGPCILLYDHRICPDELSLQGHIIFAQRLCESQKSTDGPNRLNDFIDIKHVRKMGIKQFVNNYYSQSLTVDVTDCQRLENLSHLFGTVVGLSPQSKIKELRISTACNLSNLPVNLEMLELGKDQHVSCTSEVNLPQLKHLYIPSRRFLPNFLNCTNLTDLIIGDGDYHDYPNVPIPLRVSRMFLNTSYCFRPNNIAHLDYLHLQLLSMWNFSLALEFLRVVHSQTLVVSFQSDYQKPLRMRNGTMHRGTLKTSEASMVDLIRIVDLQSARGGIVAVGEIEWDADPHSFLARVDRESAFYLFRNRKGRRIDEVEFEKLIQLKCGSMFLTKDEDLDPDLI